MSPVSKQKRIPTFVLCYTCGTRARRWKRTTIVKDLRYICLRCVCILTSDGHREGAA